MTQVSEFFNPNHDVRGRFSTGSGRGKHSPRYDPKYTVTDKLKAQQRLLMDASKLRSGLTPGEKIARSSPYR